MLLPLIFVVPLWSVMVTPSTVVLSSVYLPSMPSTLSMISSLVLVMSERVFAMLRSICRCVGDLYGNSSSISSASGAEIFGASIGSNVMSRAMRGT